MQAVEDVLYAVLHVCVHVICARLLGVLYHDSVYTYNQVRNVLASIIAISLLLTFTSEVCSCLAVVTVVSQCLRIDCCL